MTDRASSGGMTSSGGASQRGALAPLAAKLRLTEGQLYTLLIGLALAAGALAIGFPPLRDVAPTRASALPNPSPARAAPIASSPTAPNSTPVAGYGGTGPLSGPTENRPAGGSDTVVSFADGGPVGKGVAFADVPEPGLPAAVAVTEAGGVFVATDNPEGDPVVFQYSPAGLVTNSIRIRGLAATRAHGVTGLAYRAGRLYATTVEPAQVLLIDPVAKSATRHAAIPNLPLCLFSLAGSAPCEPGLVDHAPLPRGIAVDTRGWLFVADAAQATVWRVSPTGAVEPWLSDLRFVGVDAQGPGGVVFNGTDDLFVSVTAAVTAGGGGSVFRVPVEESGAAGEPEALVTTALGDDPLGLAVGVSGSVYLTLSGVDQIAVYNPDGTERARYPGGGLAITQPVAIAFRGASLLATSNAARGGSIVRIPVGERGA